jgi:carbon monoxide dehydrogenase subunit G
MPQFHHTLAVKAAPDRAWAVVGDLARVDRWIPGIVHVVVEGTIHRVCTFANGVVQHEDIRDYSNETRSYGYTIVGSPLPVKNNRGSFAVVAAGNGSQIIWDAAFDVLDSAQEGQVTQLWQGAVGGALESLRHWIESGE